MALRTKVKVSEITNLSDARYCAGMGVEMIGFALDEDHPRFIELSTARDITSWISGIQVAGEFQGHNYSNIEYLSQELNIDYIQLRHPVDIVELKKIHKPVIIQLFYTSGQESLLEEQLDKYSADKIQFLLESDENVNLESLSETLTRWCSKHSIILGFGIESENLNLITEHIKPWGIALKGGDEIKPGLKSFEELAEILESLEGDQ